MTELRSLVVVDGSNERVSKKAGEWYTVDAELQGDSVGATGKPAFSFKKTWEGNIGNP